MSRYSSAFAALKDRGEGALAAFLMLGDPDLKTSSALLDALVEGGADMIEAGIPFSDPIADGPVIQAASTRALAAGVRQRDCFDLLAGFRERHRDIPVGILTYANPVVARGRTAFYRSAAEAGVDSILVADVPATESEPFVREARGWGVDPVLIAATNTPAGTLRRIAQASSGYVYCLSRKGVTGVRSELRLSHRELLERLGEAGAPPAMLGFGIARSEHVRLALSEGAAGAIVGSAIVRLIETAPDDPVPAVRELVASLKAATRKSPEIEPGLEARMEAGDVRR